MVPVSLEAKESYVLKKITLSESSINNQGKEINDQQIWDSIIYRDVAISDSGEIYALGEKSVSIFNDNGQVIKEIPVPVRKRQGHFSFTYNDQVEALNDGNTIYVQYAHDTYILNSDGKIIKTFNEVLPKITRLPDGSFKGHNTLYDKDFNKIYKMRQTNEFTVDRYGNRYYSGKGIVGIYTSNGELIKKISLEENAGFMYLLGIDDYLNLYFLGIDYKAIYKYDGTGKYIAKIPASFFSGILSDKVIAAFPEITDVSHIYYHVSGRGDVYQYFKFEGFTEESFRQWFKDGGKYSVYKYEKTYDYTNGALFILKKINSKKYVGNIGLYLEKDLVVNNEQIDNGLYAKVLRNEIFARNGRVFSDDVLKQIFESTDWYRPNPDYSDDMLNDIEKKNVQFILDYEKEMGWK